MEKISKPWGFEEILEQNDKYMLKRLTMKKGHRCSLQYHEKKTETIYVISGELLVFDSYLCDICDSAWVLKPGDCLTITSGRRHRMEAIQKTVYLEASTSENEDVVRIDDDYERI